MINKLLILILSFAFIIRLIPIDFPSLTADEARVAFRSYTLAKTGKDELSRPYPLLFNSLTDYQLPVTSYVAVVGTAIFGKSELGARIPFILIGTLLVFLVYLISKKFSEKPLFWLISSLIAATSPPLIFLSKIPNEIIILTTLLVLIFYLLVNSKKTFLIICVAILAVLTSKLSWFILLPFVLITVHIFQKGSNKKILILSTVLITILAFGLFLTIPQSKRSLIENNISLFNDVTIKNGIDKLRGQGLESDWPPIVERFLFNKAHFIFTAFLHWTSHFNPAIYFGRFDDKGMLNYSFIGAFLKALIIPAFLGIMIIKRGEFKSLSLFLYSIFLTLPAFLVYPKHSLELVVLTLPFFSIFISLGFSLISKKAISIILLFVLLELIINIYSFSAERINTDTLRPNWIKSISQEISTNSQKNLTAISDDLVEEVVPFLQWYGFSPSAENYADIKWPYKFRVYSQANVKIIGFNDKFTTCGVGEKIMLYLSKRDLEKVQKELKFEINKAFKNIKGEDRTYLISNVCLD